MLNYRKDGTEFRNRVTIGPIEGDGEIVQFVGVQQRLPETTDGDLAPTCGDRFEDATDRPDGS